MKKIVALLAALCLMLCAGALAQETGEHADALVIYFSCTGTTRGVAETLAAVTGADLWEIVPAEPYTEEDLNYRDRSTRATWEQDHPDTRPEIAGLRPAEEAGEEALLLSLEEIDLTGYTAVYVGYPIWWGEQPRILCTLVEQLDFTGLAVIPFCTSGGSGIGRSDTDLAALSGTGEWLRGARLSGSATGDELRAWTDSLK